MATTTKKPSGLTITRNKNKFVAKWKCSEKYESQTAEYCINDGKWIMFKKGVGAKTTKKALSIKLADYYPESDEKLKSVAFRIKGKKEKANMSDWSKKDFDVKLPKKPKITVSTTTWPSCKFAWKVGNAGADDNSWFTELEWQSILLTDSNISKGEKISESEWKNPSQKGTSTNADSDKSIIEDSGSFETGKSYTRWFRARAKGPRGASDWGYAKHVYADSPRAEITNVEKTRDDSSNGYIVQVFFNTSQTNAFPISKIETEYTFAVPGENASVPDSLSGWTKVESVIKKNDKTSSSIFRIDRLPNENECLFVRVNTIYDSRTTYGIPAIVDYGRLSDPTGLTVGEGIDPTTKRVTVAANNTSTVPGSYLEVYLYSDATPDGVLIGAISNGDTSTVIDLTQEVTDHPTILDGKVSFGVKAVVKLSPAVVGTFALTSDTTIVSNKPYYEYKTYNYGLFETTGYVFVTDKAYHSRLGHRPVDLGWYEHSVSIVSFASTDDGLMSSALATTGGDIPLPPRNVIAVKHETIPGTIRVTWDWPWVGADYAEVSWADHEDAWESTDEPTTYVVSKMKSSSLNISNLETGIKWYIRVRLMKSSGDSANYSGYYPEIIPVDLASAPAIPALGLSDEVITETGTVTATWVYSSTDDTMQDSAEIVEVIGDTTPPTYKTLGTVRTQQYYNISASDEDVDWHAGETHYVAVKVRSASGRESEYSDSVAIKIADPVTCVIGQTSLERGAVEIEPETYHSIDGIISFDTEFEQPVTKLSVAIEPVQNLNGYDHPWVGGAGDNKLSCGAAFSETASGITFTHDGNGTYTISGTSTQNRGYTFDVPESIMPDTAYLHLMNNQTSGNVAFVLLYNDTQLSAPSLSSVNRIVDASSSIGGRTVNKLRLYINNGQTVNITLSPMVLTTNAVTDFIPYSNICPITGWDGVSVYKAGKNLARLANKSGQYNGLTIVSDGAGTVKLSGTKNTASWTQNAVGETFMLPAGTYTMTLRLSGTITEQGVSLGIANHYETVTPTNTTVIQTFTYTKPTTLTYSIWTAAGDYDAILTTQIERGAESTDFEPYQGTTYTPEFKDAQGNTLTVYGGESEIVGGVLTVTRKMLIADGSQTVSPSQKNRFYINVSEAKRVNASNQTTYAGVVCDRLPSKTWASLGSENGIGCAPLWGAGVAFKNPDITTAADWKTYFTNNPTQLSYELETPETYQLTPNEVTTLIGTNNIWSDAGEVTVRTAEAVEEGYLLKRLPFTIPVDVSGESGETTMIIERREPYKSERPDEVDLNGFAGETIALQREYSGDTTFVIDNDKNRPIGRLDDGAQYTLSASFRDSMNQTADAEPINFVVDWEHQAAIPSATAVIDEENLIAILTPIAPQGAAPTDVCDIYRLSADKPELIVRGATFGVQYVDPYPTIGEFGGHRFVTRTANDDYITEDKEFAWVDLGPDDGDILNVHYNILDFDDYQSMPLYEVDLSNSWSKDFQETKYAGGSVQGDWTKAVSRTGSINYTAVSDLDQELIQQMRRLAEYTDKVHVRTKDGSSYYANIEVSETPSYTRGPRLHKYDLTITRVHHNVHSLSSDEELDGMTYDQWKDINNPYRENTT